MSGFGSVVDFKNNLPPIVDAMLPTRTSDLGLLITVNIRCSVYLSTQKKGGEDVEISEDIQLLFGRPSNYTKILSRIPFSQMPDVVNREPEAVTAVWNLECDHDCWRHAGLEIIRSRFQEIEKETMNRAKTHDGNKVYTHIGFSVFRGLRYVLIKGIKSLNPSDKWKDRRHNVTLDWSIDTINDAAPYLLKKKGG